MSKNNNKGKNYRSLSAKEISKIKEIMNKNKDFGPSEITTRLEDEGMLKSLPSRKVRYDKVHKQMLKIKRDNETSKEKKSYRNLSSKEISRLRNIVKDNKDFGPGEITTMLEDEGMLKGFPNRDVRYDKVRREMTRIKRDIEKSSEKSVEVKFSGDNVEGNIDVPANEKTNVREAAEKLGLNPDEYSCEWARVSNYMVTDEDGNEVERTSRRYSFKRKAISTQDEMDKLKFYEDYLEYCKNVNNQRMTKGDFSLVVPLPDLHIGEDPADEMVKSYTKTFVKTIIPYMEDMYFARKGRVRNIDIVTLGDIIHFDTYQHTTTKGTYVGGHSSPDTAKKFAFMFLRWLIEEMDRRFDVPIRVIYVRGNHDTVHGLSIIEQLFYFFMGSGNKKVLFSIDENAFCEQKRNNPQYMWVKYGDMGITYCHGQFIKRNINNVPDIANHNARREVSFNTVIYGHLHHREEGNSGVHQHNFGLSTPNYAYDEYAGGSGFITDPEFYLFSVNHNTNRVSYEPFPSKRYDKIED